MKPLSRRSCAYGAKAKICDGERLAVLPTHIDAYEAEHYPMEPPNPIKAINSVWASKGSRAGTWRNVSGLEPA
jgi:antitoxin component HigA of HigAB toxin-antitoxin module